MRSIIALAMSSSAKISPHLENSMLVVRMSAIRSYVDVHWEVTQMVTGS